MNLRELVKRFVAYLSPKKEIGGWPCPHCEAKPVSYKSWPPGFGYIIWKCGSLQTHDGYSFIGDTCVKVEDKPKKETDA